VSYRVSDGQTISQRYYPWGTVRRGPNNALPTDYTFTGQKLDESIKLMYYGSRYYDPALGRFVQADTMVPEPGNPQALNRYAYTLNNPLRYVDPSGHWACEDADCRTQSNGPPSQQPSEAAYWVSFTSDEGAPSWSESDKTTAQTGVQAIGGAIARTIRQQNRLLYNYGEEASLRRGPSARAAFSQVFGRMTFRRVSEECGMCYGETMSAHEIWVYSNAKVADPRFIIHELGHAFNQSRNWRPVNALAAEWKTNPKFPRRSDEKSGFAGPAYGWQQSRVTSASEEFADMFIGWTYNTWQMDASTGGPAAAGRARSEWMTTNMAEWLSPATAR